MNKDVIKALIKEGQDEIQEVELNRRRFEFEVQGRYVLVGVRQAGKSYLLYQRAKMMPQDMILMKLCISISTTSSMLSNLSSKLLS